MPISCDTLFTPVGLDFVKGCLLFWSGFNPNSFDSLCLLKSTATLSCDLRVREIRACLFNTFLIPLRGRRQSTQPLRAECDYRPLTLKNARPS